MNTQQLVKQFLQAHYDTTNAKVLADDHGTRIRVKSAGRVEIASTYFYESQNHVGSLYNAFETFARQHGFQASPELPDHLVSRQIDFHYKPWPKTSWATLQVDVKEA